ncbi:MAG: SUMF1/EgtB/PvdO family nonheme iron enzyme [Candidatus Margulisbacteria bacterium]|nr:SUMF1/EgtB/PvdO family nonheme iron enzyme [Candidatus Margulisiibacteriota bacterium]
MPQRNLPALRGVVESASFVIGKERLGPCLTALFKEQGIELKGISLDNVAKIRLLGMNPSLERRAADDETAERILSSLELSVFLAQDQTLYILGDKGNINLMATDKPISTAAPASQPKIVIPEMIDMGNYRIMKGEVTVGLFKQVMQGYTFIIGGNVSKFSALLDDPSQESKALTYVTLSEAIEFAKRLSDLTGRRFRLQTEEEWLQAKDRLSGDNRTWTTTTETDETDGGSGIESFYVLCSLRDGRSFSNISDHRRSDKAIRLVEDISTEAEEKAKDQDALAIEMREMVRKALWEQDLSLSGIAGIILENEANIYPNDLNKKSIFLAELITMINDTFNADGYVVTYDQLIRSIVNNIDTPPNAALIGKIIGRLALSEDDRFTCLLKVIDGMSYTNKGIAMSAAGLDNHRYKARLVTNDMTEENIKALVDGMESFLTGDK